MDEATKEDIASHCIEALSNVGAPTEFCTFYADVIQCEYDMTHTNYRMQKEFKDEIVKQPFNCFLLFTVIQAMTKKFYQWKGCVDSLSERGAFIPSLKTFSPNQHVQPQTIVKSHFSLETTEMNLQEGEDITIMDATLPDRLKVRNSKGEEGYVPVLSFLLHSPDNNSTNAVERLQVHLLTSWTECVRKVKFLLFNNLIAICKLLASDWTKIESCLKEEKDRDRVNRRFFRLLDVATLHENTIDLNKLHKSLFSLEKEMITFKCTDLKEIIETVSNLDKAVLCYHHLYKQWRNFRLSLKELSPHPIQLVQRLDQLLQISHGQNFKYYEMKLTLDETIILEEITYINLQSGERMKQVSRIGCAAARHPHGALSTEQVTSSSLEERKHFIIRSVVDPRDHSEISMQAAIVARIIDTGRGLYVDPSTGSGIAIPLAMSEGLINVEYVSTKRTIEKKEAIGLMTIRTAVKSREYTLTGAIDARTAEKVDADEALRRGLISEEEDCYVNGLTGDRLPLTDAIDEGWVLAAFDDEAVEAEFDVKTYEVTEVLDQRRSTRIGFAEAVKRGLIDRETGDYLNNSTGVKLYVVDAIREGFLTAKVVEDTATERSAENAVIVDKIHRVTRNVLKGLKVK